mmetsp:Transcript_14490/g.41667  ORF Transcript_14490/g.41667 Transcript_14490/m.41667 type:complete len:243 (-) Transcript_14490:113-841(-)
MFCSSIACIGGEGGISRGWFNVPLEEDLAELSYNLEGTHEGHGDDDDASHTGQFGQKLGGLGRVSGGLLLCLFLFEGLLLPGQGVIVIKIFGRKRPCITISLTSAVAAAVAALVIVLIGVRLVIGIILIDRFGLSTVLDVDRLEGPAHNVGILENLFQVWVLVEDPAHARAVLVERRDVVGIGPDLLHQVTHRVGIVRKDLLGLGLVGHVVIVVPVRLRCFVTDLFSVVACVRRRRLSQLKA